MTASWSGSNDPTAYKSLARRCAQWRAPLGSSPHRQTDRHSPDAELCQKAPAAVHHRSACSGVKALRNTSDARRQAAKLCYRFGPLTPSARSANLIVGDGTKNGLSRSEQRTGNKTKNKHLTRKAPYKFESNFRLSWRFKKCYGFSHSRRGNKRGLSRVLSQREGQRTTDGVMFAGKPARSEEVVLFAPSRNSVLPDGSPAAKEIVEAICSARRERTFTPGMASNGSRH
jgi:hypothetical protein